MLVGGLKNFGLSSSSSSLFIRKSVGAAMAVVVIFLCYSNVVKIYV